MSKMANVVDIAKAEAAAGVKEVANNDIKYGKWYGLNNVSWCAIFVSWCFNQAGLAANVAAQTKKGFASCDAGLKWFTKNNKLVPVGQAQAGDIAFFQFDKDAEPDHVGIVAKNDGKYLYCYEGNTSSGDTGSQSNGDGVFMRKRAYSLVMGVARP
jgi:cell wall-associated NlpC family hydrolase